VSRSFEGFTYGTAGRVGSLSWYAGKVVLSVLFHGLLESIDGFAEICYMWYEHWVRNTLSCLLAFRGELFCRGAGGGIFSVYWVRKDLQMHGGAAIIRRVTGRTSCPCRLAWAGLGDRRGSERDVEMV